MPETAPSKLLREEAKKLRQTAGERASAAERLRAEAADHERQSDDMTRRAAECDAAANQLTGAGQ